MHLVTAVALAAAVTVVVAQKPPAPAASPKFQVDPTWPKELPNNWILGSVTGVFLDAKDHVWVTHLPETLTEEETSRGAEAADRDVLCASADGD